MNGGRCTLAVVITLFGCLFSISELSSQDQTVDPTELLHYATEGNLTAIKQLVAMGADITIRNEGGQSALMFAAQNGHTDIVTLLVDAGADVNAQADDGATALIFASMFNHPSSVEILLKNGADPDLSTYHYGQTTLMVADAGGNVEIVQILLSNGVVADTRDTDGSSALRYALSQQHYTVAKLLMDKGSSINGMASNGLTPLIDAVIINNIHAVQFLINNGADINLYHREGASALVYAAAKGFQPIVELLIESGAAIDAKAGDGQTALIAATRGGYYSIVEVLLDAGSDASLTTQNGISALTFAYANEQTEIMDILRARQAGLGSGAMESTFLPHPIKQNAVDEIERLLNSPDLPRKPFTLTTESFTEIPEDINYIPLPPEKDRLAIEGFMTQWESGISASLEVQENPIVFGPHLTTLLNRSGSLKELDHSIMVMILQKGMPGVLISSGIRGESTSIALGLVRNLLYSGDNIQIRRLNNDELDWYWTSISWDIEEPIYVFENSNHKILIDFHENGAIWYVDLLEELLWDSIPD